MPNAVSFDASGEDVLPGIEFPVLCFNEGIVDIHHTYEDVTTAKAAAVKKGGWYDGLLIVGANGIGVRVKGARKLRRMSFSIFLNPIVRVGLELEGPPFEVSVDDVRRRVLRSFKDWHGWETRGDFGDLRAKVETARSIRDIIRLIESPDAAAE